MKLNVKGNGGVVKTFTLIEREKLGFLKLLFFKTRKNVFLEREMERIDDQNCRLFWYTKETDFTLWSVKVTKTKAHNTHKQHCHYLPTTSITPKPNRSTHKILYLHWQYTQIFSLFFFWWEREREKERRNGQNRAKKMILTIIVLQHIKKTKYTKWWFLLFFFFFFFPYPINSSSTHSLPSYSIHLLQLNLSIENPTERNGRTFFCPSLSSFF